MREKIERASEVWFQARLQKHPGEPRPIYAESADDISEQPSPLVGRDALLAEARSLLEQNTRVLLQGFGGMGKTALDATLAANWIDDEKGAVLWLRTGSESADTIFETLAYPFNAQQ